MKAAMLGDGPDRVKTAGVLYVVATPIGNLEDLSERAVKTLKTVNLIACEDTRRTRALLTHLDVSKPLRSLFEHNERERVDEILDTVRSGASVALVSDAGTPTISDPGYRLVRAAREEGLRVVPIPGASAAIAALSVSGLPTHSFFFDGFPPRSGSARRDRFHALAALEATLVFYEATHRIADTLRDALAVFGDREAFIARELTKKHEETLFGRLSTLAARFAEGSETRGEFVLLIDGSRGGRAARVSGEPRAAEPPPDPRTRALDLAKAARERGLSPRAAAREAAAATGLDARDVYAGAFARGPRVD
jgi:16S rRNA (cytidine1402-2'-O)-methyltransferase